MRQEPLIQMPDPDWIGLLKAEVAKGRTIADVAREIGMPRPSLSFLISGKYPAKLDRKTRIFAAKVTALYSGQIWCPHLRNSISAAVCAGHHTAPMAMSDPGALKHWVACRSCPQNPIRERNSDAV
jgi:hypothetical protein